VDVDIMTEKRSRVGSSSLEIVRDLTILFDGMELHSFPGDLRKRPSSKSNENLHPREPFLLSY